MQYITDRKEELSVSTKWQSKITSFNAKIYSLSLAEYQGFADKLSLCMHAKGDLINVLSILTIYGCV